MESKSRKTIQSGIEPVDKLLGGLDSGRLYLVHGEATPASLFGISFLIEGLKRGERVALIINYTPEEAIRRFARVGYDCLEDIYNGRLIILEWAGDTHHASGSSDLTAVLQELKWLMGEANPERIVFEPIARIVGGGRDDGESRAREFAAWAAGTGSTSVLIADDTSEKVIRAFRQLVNESFRFDKSSASGQAVQFIAFEKSPELPGQTIEVDTSRGIFVGKARPEKSEGAPRRTPASPEEAAAFFREMEGIARSELDARSEEPTKSTGRARQARPPEAPRSPLEDETFGRRPSADRKTGAAGARPAPTPNADVFADILGDLVLDQDKAEPATARSAQPSAEADLVASITDRAVEELLSPPRRPLAKDVAKDAPAGAAPGQPVSETSSEARPEDFAVLAITGDDHAHKQISRALSQYRLHRESEGIGGLAKLISLRPDLVVLDLDLPVVDGFKVLAHIRTSLNMPIIVMSSSHLRASDRIQSMEMGADYYMTKPFSVKELRQKARQLIARDRGITEWITSPARSEAPSYVPSPAALFDDDAVSSGAAFHARTVDESPAYDERDTLRDYPDRTGEFVRVPYIPEPRDFRRGGREEHVDREGRTARGQERDEPPAPREKARTTTQGTAGAGLEPEPPGSPIPDPFIPYRDFAKRVEEKVKEAMSTGASFSVVGCRLPSDAAGRMGASGVSSGVIARRLLSLASLVVRGGDLVSINSTNDLVVLLADANAAGARAFVKRLTERAKEKMDREPEVWLRSFPALEDPDITEDASLRA